MAKAALAVHSNSGLNPGRIWLDDRVRLRDTVGQLKRASRGGFGTRLAKLVDNKDQSLIGMRRACAYRCWYLHDGSPG